MNEWTDAQFYGTLIGVSFYAIAVIMVLPALIGLATLWNYDPDKWRKDWICDCIRRIEYVQEGIRKMEREWRG